MRALLACLLLLAACDPGQPPRPREPIELTHPAAAIPAARPVLQDLEAQKQQAREREQAFDQAVEANR